MDELVHGLGFGCSRKLFDIYMLTNFILHISGQDTPNFKPKTSNSKQKYPITHIFVQNNN